eukprot:1357898-Pleurochrysis_carterae.AAC.1
MGRGLLSSLRRGDLCSDKGVRGNRQPRWQSRLCVCVAVLRRGLCKLARLDREAELPRPELAPPSGNAGVDVAAARVKLAQVARALEVAHRAAAVLLTRLAHVQRALNLRRTQPPLHAVLRPARVVVELAKAICMKTCRTMDIGRQQACYW